jgi:hypothetical protein
VTNPPYSSRVSAKMRDIYVVDTPYSVLDDYVPYMGEGDMSSNYLYLAYYLHGTLVSLKAL